MVLFLVNEDSENFHPSKRIVKFGHDQFFAKAQILYLEELNMRNDCNQFKTLIQVLHQIEFK